LSTICSSVDVASLCIIDSDSDNDDSDDDDYFRNRITEEIVVGEGNNIDDEEKDGDTSSTIVEENKYSRKYLKEKLKRAKSAYDKATQTAADEIKKLELNEHIKPIYHDNTKLLHDLHKYCGGENGCTNANRTQNSFICNKRYVAGIKCEGAFKKTKVLNPNSGKFEYMVKYLCEHTCSKVVQKRAPNFPIPITHVIPYIKYLVIKQPETSIPLLLNVLEGAIGNLFSEEKRVSNGTVAVAYRTVYTARDFIRDKYCGVIDHKDLYILPKLKTYIESLDKETKFVYILDNLGAYKGKYITDA
jgi:hypothetical protein